MNFLGIPKPQGRFWFSLLVSAVLLGVPVPSWADLQPWTGPLILKFLPGMVIEGSDQTDEAPDSELDLDRLYHIPLTTSPTRSLFKVPPELRPRVDFWEKIYSQYSTMEMVLHDPDDLSIVYEVIDFRKAFRKNDVSEGEKRRLVKNRKIYYRNILYRLAENGGKPLGAEDQRVLSLFPDSVSPRRLQYAGDNIRGQLGQRDKFVDGISRSGKYLEKMYEVFRSFDLPIELTVLPHVESSFNYNAYSKAGAAGIWQFTRGTGRKFMTIGSTLDERRDPIASTVAAAKLLRMNYQELGRWPLAVTAYNHGLEGVRQGSQRTGPELDQMIRSYRSRYWGFASKNFYAEFLAALELVTQCGKNFGYVKLQKPIDFDDFVVRDYVTVASLEKKLGVPREVLRIYNPALHETVWSDRQRVPRGFMFRIPKENGAPMDQVYASIPQSEKFSAQNESGYRVGPGDTLYKISRRFGMPVQDLARINGLRDKSLLRVGQKLEVTPSAETPATEKEPEPAVSEPVEVASASGTESQDNSEVGGQDSTDGSTQATLAPLESDSSSPSGSKSDFTPAALTPPKSDPFSPSDSKSDSTPTTYTVKNGDTLSKIGRKFHVDNRTLLALNHLKDPHLIKPGQMLTLAGNVDVSEIPTEEKTARAVPASGDAVPKADRSPYDAGALKQARVTGNQYASITVEPEETLGHYGDWSGTTIAFLRQVNQFSKRKTIRPGDTVRIPLKNRTLDKFLEKRVEFHQGIRDGFYETFQVVENEEIQIKTGQTVWKLCNEIYGIPYWLLRDYNQGVDVNNLKKGQILIIPIVSKKS